MLYLLNIRYSEITKLKVKLEGRKDLDDSIYISMIKDIYKDQLDLINVCRFFFIKEGFELENKGFEFKAADFLTSV